MRRSGNRFSVHAMSAISTKGRMLFMVFTEHFTAEVMCRFMERLAGHVDHKVHLVVDGHSAHRSKKVRDWLAAHPDDVELHFPPPYSPELNPDELVNAERSTVCPSSTGPETRPNPPPRPGSQGQSEAVRTPNTSGLATAHRYAPSGGRAAHNALHRDKRSHMLHLTSEPNDIQHLTLRTTGEEVVPEDDLHRLLYCDVPLRRLAHEALLVHLTARAPGAVATVLATDLAVGDQIGLTTFNAHALTHMLRGDV
ncbi:MULTISPECIES: transposase [Streptomyces]|uniref:transposase n=1 Tax=Streptomyces TaxID=1883 RepID=UPI001FD7838E|nr:transposase [Streptomyces griseolus]